MTVGADPPRDVATRRNIALPEHPGANQTQWCDGVTADSVTRSCSR